MTAPRDPEHVDPEAAAARSVRRRRHAAPDDHDDDEEYFRAQRAEIEAEERAEAERVAQARAIEEQAAQEQAAHERAAQEQAAQEQAAQERAAQEQAAQEQAAQEHEAREQEARQQAAQSLSDAPSDPVEPAPVAVAQTATASVDPLSSTPDVSAADDADLEPRRRHAAEGSSFRPQGWMIGVAATVVVGLVAWLVIALVSGGDTKSTDKASSSETASTSAGPTPVDVASLPPLLCMGSSYITVDTGKSAEQLLADAKGAEEQFPGSKLSTIPPGCVAGVDTRDDVVLALGPYPSIEEACTAGKALQGVTFQAYAGSADLGLTKTTCA